MKIDRTRKSPRTPRRTAVQAGAPRPPAEPVVEESDEQKPSRRRAKKEAKGDD